MSTCLNQPQVFWKSAWGQTMRFALGKFSGYRRNRHRGTFLMHCLWEGWDVCLSLFLKIFYSLHYISLFGTWDVWNAGNCPRGPQARYKEYCGQLYQSPVTVHRSELPSSVTMGDPDPGDSAQNQKWKMQFNPTDIYWTHMYSREVKQGPSFQEVCCLVGETGLYVTSYKWVLLETKTKCTEKEEFWVREERGSFPKEVACEHRKLPRPAIG